MSRIESFAHSGTSILESAIDGPSFGLTFALILSSRVFGLSLPTDLAASAALDADGRIQPVDGLSTKIAGLQALAPRITRFLVAEVQREDAQAAAGDTLHVFGVRTLGEALTIVFESALEEALVRAGDDGIRRRQLIRCFLRLSLASRDAAIDWKPIERAATKARDEWKSLDEAERYSLEFTIAVAARHDRNAGDLSAPPEDWLSKQPLPVRLQAAAHLVQRAADVGNPSAAVSMEWVSRYAACEPREAFPEQLRLLGAQARLWAVTGRPSDALRAQEEIASAWWAAFDAAPISFPLSEWFRLSGACGNPESFDRAVEFHAELARSVGLDGDSASYIQLARSRAGLELGVLANEETLKALTALIDQRVPDHLFWSAHRWLLRLHRTAGRHDEARKVWIGLTSSNTPDARTQLALATLDDSTEVATARDGALLDLQMFNPGPTKNLLDAARLVGEEPTGYVARFFPY